MAVAPLRAAKPALFRRSARPGAARLAAMSLRARFVLPWPLPAVLSWLAAWAVFRAAGAGPAAFGLGCALGFGAAWLVADGRWRRALVAGGFPLSALALGATANLPGWAWGLAALALALAYPLRAWRDAPFFPTPAGALDGLAQAAPLAPGARVLDAGCGIGHGLAELTRAYPAARVEGIEWSRPLAALAGWRCRGIAQVRRGDMWAADWRGCALVYLFQRPESMPRAAAKAAAELPGGWLASLEFPVPDWTPSACLPGGAGGRPVWLYRVPGSTPGASGR